VTAYDHALLTLLEGMLALRSNAHERAAGVLGQAAQRLEAVNRGHSAARAHLLRAEALLASGAVRKAEDALNRAAELVIALGCEGYLRPAARLTRRVLAERRVRRHLRRDTRLLLDRLAAAAGPRLSILPAVHDAAPASLPVWLLPFGAGRIRLAEHDVDMAALPLKARELLFFAGRMGTALSRDAILDAVWEGDTAAIAAFWEAGRHLRRLLGEDSWGRQAGHYALRVPVHDESRRFDELAAAALGGDHPVARVEAAEQALAIASPGGYLEWCDSLWATTERIRVVHDIATVALVAAQIYDRLGRSQDAIAACRRAVLAEPLEEAPRKALIRQLAACGDIGVAVQEYMAYRALLHEEMAVEPSAELRALAMDLGCSG
jgi:DNA-binding SARP family transcriptional activator